MLGIENVMELSHSPKRRNVIVLRRDLASSRSAVVWTAHDESPCNPLFPALFEGLMLASLLAGE